MRTNPIVALALLTLLAGTAGCPKNLEADQGDMTVGKTCSELCNRYYTCYQAAHPEFVGMNALVPCENTCFAGSEQLRIDLRVCHAKDCAAYLVCGMTAGLTLMAKPPTPDAAGTGDMSVAADMTALPDQSTVD